MESYDVSDNIGPGNPDRPEKRGLFSLPAIVGLAVVVDLYVSGSLFFQKDNLWYHWLAAVLLLIAAGSGVYFALSLRKALSRQEEAGDGVTAALALFFLIHAAELFLVTAQFLRA